MSIHSKESQSTPNLEDIRQENDGGVDAISGFDYQFHFAAQKCLEMLAEPDKYEFVSSETHEDVVVRLKNGIYQFYQVKQKAMEQWTLSDLKSRNVWANFIKVREKFGSGNSFWFVSNQTAKFSNTNGKGSRRPNLGQMQKLTQRGKNLCNQNIKDQDNVNILLTQMDEDWGFNNLIEAEAFFWNIRILTAYGDETGLRKGNIYKLREILEARSINTDNPNSSRIYDSITTLLRKRLQSPATATIEEAIEMRKIRLPDLEKCITGPFSEPRLEQFMIEEKHDDLQRRTLRQKTEKLKTVDPKAVEYFINSRTFFAVKFRQQQSYAALYIAELRQSVWGICHSKSVLNDGKLEETYKAILEGLYKLADQQQKKDSPIDDVDFDYLHGMMCQLTAECHYEWHCWNTTK